MLLACDNGVVDGVVQFMCTLNPRGVLTKHACMCMLVLLPTRAATYVERRPDVDTLIMCRAD